MSDGVQSMGSSYGLFFLISDGIVWVNYLLSSSREREREREIERERERERECDGDRER